MLIGHFDQKRKCSVFTFVQYILAFHANNEIVPSEALAHVTT